ANWFYRIIFVFMLFSPIFYTTYKFLPNDQIKPFDCSHLCRHSSIAKRDTLQFGSFHTIRHFPTFVCPQNFRNLADWIYGWPDQFLEHLDIATNEGKFIAPCLPT